MTANRRVMVGNENSKLNFVINSFATPAAYFSLGWWLVASQVPQSACRFSIMAASLSQHRSASPCGQSPINREQRLPAKERG
jgi:hypothetical protein